MSIERLETACRVIIDPPAPGPWNMAIDEALLIDAAENGIATLRIYQWSEPTLSLGYFQRIDEREQHAASARCGVVRRQTGGGAILHDRELTYSLILPAAHPLSSQADTIYRAVHESFIAVLQPLVARVTPSARLAINESGCSSQDSREPFLCFQRRACGDVVLRIGETTHPNAPQNVPPAAGWKILGSAQRRHRGAVLQHGSLLLGTSPSAPELPGVGDLTGTNIPIVELIDPLSRHLVEALELRLFRLPEPPAGLESLARQLGNTKYGHPSWTKRR